MQERHRNAGEGGEEREGKYDDRTVNTVRSELSDEGVGSAGEEASEQCKQSGKARDSGARLHNEGSAEKCDKQCQEVDPARLFAQQENRHQGGEEGSHFIQHIGVPDVHFPDGIEVQEEPGCAEEAAQEESGEAASRKLPEIMTGASEQIEGDEDCDEVTEKCFFPEGQISGKLYEEGHQGKEEGGAEDIQDAPKPPTVRAGFGELLQIRHSRFLSIII